MNNDTSNEVPPEGPVGKMMMAFIATQATLVSSGALFTKNVWLGIAMLFVYAGLMAVCTRLEQQTNI